MAPLEEVPPGEMPPVWLALVPFEAVPLEVAEPDADEFDADEFDADELEVDELEVDELEVDELDVDELDADELALAGVDADEVALGVSAGVAVGVELPHGLPVALAVALPLGLVFASAEAVVVAVLVALLVALAVAVPVLVAVVLSVGLAPLLARLAPVPLLAGLVAGLLAGVAFGFADLVALVGDDEGLGGHVVAVAVARAVRTLVGVTPAADAPIGLPAPPALGTALLLWEEVIPTAVPSETKAWRSGGSASATPMANTTKAAARADRSSPSRQSRDWRRACERPPGEACPGEPPRSEFQRRILSARKPPDAGASVAPECLLAYAGPDPIRARIRSSPSGRGSTWSAAVCRA